MDDILVALQTPIQEPLGDGLLDSFLNNARRILCSGLVASTLLASVATISIDSLASTYKPLTALVKKSETMDTRHVQEMSNRLQAFFSLKPGWNNDDSSVAISQIAVDFIDRTLQCSEASDWQNWMVFPEQAGSVLLDYDSKDCRASISVGEDGFSYLAYGPGFYDTADRGVLSERELLVFVRKVKEYGRS